MNYRQRIIWNRQKLEALDEYPHFKKFLSMKGGIYRKRLETMLDLAETTKYQEKTEFNTERFFNSERHIAALMHETPKTTHYWLVLFACIGLITRYIPTEETADTQRQINNVKMAQKHPHFNATANYSFKTYGKKQLEYIENKLKKWFDKGAKAKISNDDAHRIFGQKIANEVFNSHGTHSTTPTRGESLKAQRKLFVMGIAFVNPLEEIKERGYTFKSSVIYALKCALMQLDNTHRAKELKASAAGNKKLMIEKENEAERYWRECHYAVFDENKLTYRPPTKEDKQKYSLDRHEKRWIIVKA